MLVELAVANLGVISEARIPVHRGLTALTGETGAGKTMLVEALHLLSGQKSDPDRVRPGADEAVVEGLFAVGDTEWVLRRVIPARGRSRSYCNGELVTAAALGELASQLIEIHGQHSQQSLLRPSAQRDALDTFAGIDRTSLRAARTTVNTLLSRLESLGGDDRARTREIDLLRFQLDEIRRIAPLEGEDEALVAEEDLLSGALEHRRAGWDAVDLLDHESGAADAVARAVHRLDDRGPFTAIANRLRSVEAELSDIVAELRSVSESIEPDEERLAAVGARRQALVELRRKYGETFAEVVEFTRSAEERLEELTGFAQTRDAVQADLDRARAELAQECVRLGRRRRDQAPILAAAIEQLLDGLALPNGRVEILVTDTEELPSAGESVEFRLSTNPGSPLAGLSRVASGGELSRVMLALRLVLSGGPPTMVFDEVDAGIGGQAATAVADALARLGRDTQVLVVTHLAQVASHADEQVLVTKAFHGDTTITTVAALDIEERVREVSRMLSGTPESGAARRHAEELLEAAARTKVR